ncbi:MAG: hypothetical protein O8C67_08865 [Candidatus Methanoperedens sp.]|nr:hypothetical protein [Candidatus Methanoperedens sp.]
MSTPKCQSYQTTELELQFLQRIGGWRSGTMPSKIVRMYYLKGYLKGALLREDWGVVNRELMLEYVKRELGEE